MDEKGNMTSVTNSCGTTTYTWDVRNRLVGINGFNAQCSPLTASFKYDALGRRIQKIITRTDTVTDTMYLYDGLDIIQEKQNGVVSANYIRTLNIDEPLVRLTPNASRFYQTDALGSVIALTDETGNIRTTYSYDPFGNTTVSGESSDNPFQYTGRENDNTGLYYYRARYYDAKVGRFISEDPIGIAGGINLYVYTANNPMNFIDPYGLKECITLCWLARGTFSGGPITSILHHTVGGRPNTLSFDVKCPPAYPNLEDTWLTSAGDPPYSPKKWPFPEGWLHYPEGSNASTSFAVPTRTTIRDPGGLSRVRICGRCCKDC